MVQSTNLSIPTDKRDLACFPSLSLRCNKNSFQITHDSAPSKISDATFHIRKLSTLTIRYYYPLPTRDVQWLASIDISSILLAHTYALTHSRRPHFNIDRLMIELGTFGAPPSPMHGTGANQMNQVLWMKEKLRDAVKRWWIGIDRTTPNPAWTICLDLVEGLPPLVNGKGLRSMLVEYISARW
jgi:hypothetical protein